MHWPHDLPAVQSDNPENEKLLSLSVIAPWVYRLSAAGETFPEAALKISQSQLRGEKNREKRNANPDRTRWIAAPADEAAEGVRRL
jgi:hypothetical protein